MKFTKPKAIYMQIADYLCESILALELKAGDRIQSVREMAAQVEVNPNTVARTFSYLQEKEIIYNKRGVGYFVAEDALEKTKALKKDAFIHQFLPEVFKLMELLGMSFEDLRELRAESTP
ncbi:MAG: GntR family transcriptional regulator [Bacteroidota bacterium]